MSNVLRLTLLSLVSCLASSLPCAAMTNTLVYVAEFGKFNAAGQVETIGITTNVTMTVTLYSDNSPARKPLWNRRLEVPVWNGQFAVELDDAHGSSDPQAPAPQNASLVNVFDNASPNQAWYVGISNVRCGSDQQLPAGMDDTEKVGKISAVPFAVETERASAALGDFSVAGTATVVRVSVSGSFAATESVTFGGAVTCSGKVTFGGADGLFVNGPLTVTSGNLDLMKVLVCAGSVEASKSFSTYSLDVTGEGAVLTAADGLPDLESVTVSDTLAAPGGVEAEAIAAETVTVAGGLTLGENGTINWHAVGGTQPSLVASDGVYPEAADAEDLHGTANPSIGNTSSHERLDAFATATSNRTASVTVKTSGSSEVWCYAGTDGSGDAKVTLTSLCPLAPGGTDTAQVNAGVLVSHTTKELSK